MVDTLNLLSRRFYLRLNLFIFSISINEGVAAVVKCAKSMLNETKESLVFEDSLPPNIHGRLPPLPFMEFEDWDGTVRMSPMRLFWENPRGKNRPMQVN